MKVVMTFVSFFMVFQLIQAGSIVDSVDKKIKYFSNNFETEKANQLIEQKISQDPGNLKNYLLSIENKLAENVIATYNVPLQKRNELKLKLNKNTIEYSEGVLKKFEDIKKTTMNKFYLSWLYAYLGKMYGVERSWMDSFSNCKEAMDLAEDVIDKNPHLYDAYLVLGMFKYFADRLNGVAGFVADILGFSGDREKGLEYLQLAAEKGKLLENQAELLLIEIYSKMESNEFASLPYFREYLKKYPDNFNVRNWYCRELLAVDMIFEVGDYVNDLKVAKVSPYVKGVYYHKAGEYAKSKKHLQKVVTDSLVLWNGALQKVNFMLKLNKLFLGEAPAESNRLNEKYSNIYKQYKANVDEALLIARYGSRVAKFDNSKDENLSPAEISTDNKYLNGLLDYYKGVYEYKRKNYREASRHFEDSINSLSDGAGYNSIKYLINIYNKIDVNKNRVKELTDKIEDEDYERLTYCVRDLKRKYNL